jgi:hypothetical protein
MNGHPPWRAERALQRKSPAGRGAGQAMGIRHPRCPNLQRILSSFRTASHGIHSSKKMPGPWDDPAKCRGQLARAADSPPSLGFYRDEQSGRIA